MNVTVGKTPNKIDKKKKLQKFLRYALIAIIIFGFMVSFITSYNKSIYRNGYNSAIDCVFNYRFSTLSKQRLPFAAEAASFCTSSPLKTNFLGSDKK